MTFDLTISERHNTTSQHPLPVLTAGVDAKRIPDPGHTFGFMYVTVETEHGLVFLDGVAN